MMEYPLTLKTCLDRAADLFGDREIVTKLPDGTVHRYTYADMVKRVGKLANALDDLGLERGDRIATVGLNTYRHLELYFGPPCSGRTTHMCNPRLPAEHFRYIVNDAEDRVMFVHPAFVDVVERDASQFETVEQYVVLSDAVPETALEPVVAYEDLIADASPEYEWPDLDEERECGMCYTSGTTGKPKGVTYSHRGLFLHTLAGGHTDVLSVGQADTVMPVVPMFHVNCWGLPHMATLAGAKQVFPSSHTDPAALAELIDEEEVTFSAGVPTVWLEMAEYLDDHPNVDISNIDRLVVGGAAPPEWLVRKYDEEYDAPILQAWGMTETTPVGTVSTLRKELETAPPDEQYRYYATAGVPIPGVELRLRDEENETVPQDGETIGEIEVRGPWVTDGYHDRPKENRASFTDDGWLRTGDLATQDELGYIEIVDRTKDIIKSGGEWISSVELENELMAHDAVAEATVIAVDHEKWQERPMACVVLEEGADATPAELDDHLVQQFPEWWLPDRYEFVDEIPRTSTGKFNKKVLRDRYADVTLKAD